MWSVRSLAPVFGWCAATLTSIAIATVALQPVLRAATPEPATPPPGRPPAVAGQPGVTLGTPPVASSPPAAASSSAAPVGPSSRRPTPATTAAAAPPVVNADGWTVTTAGDGQSVYTKSFSLPGGHAVIQISNGRVTLISATPRPGYSVDTTQNEPGNLAVQFSQPDHYFVIHALWHNNGPFAQVSEVGR